MKEDISSVPYVTPFGKAAVRKQGLQVTVVATSYTAIEALEAASYLEERGISVEVIDLRSIVPLDMDTILESIRKTRKLIVVDTGHLFCGISAEIVAQVSEIDLICKTRRIGLPAAPTPTSHALEKVYYPDTNSIINACYDMLDIPNGKREFPKLLPTKEIIANFKGPF